MYRTRPEGRKLHYCGTECFEEAATKGFPRGNPEPTSEYCPCCGKGKLDVDMICDVCGHTPKCNAGIGITI